MLKGGGGFGYKTKNVVDLSSLNHIYNLTTKLMLQFFLLLIKDQGDAKQSIYNWLVKFHNY